MADTAIKASWVDIDALKLWSENYNQGDIGAILLSIQKFGFLNALRVWRDNTVMAGNHSLIALRQLVNGGWKPHGGAIRVNGDSVEVLIVDMSYLNQEQATAFAIADNRTASLAEPDNLALVGLLQDLANSEDDTLLTASGYDGDDLDLMLRDLDILVDTPQDAPDAQVDRAQELQDKWQVERGQVWQVGKHRVMCGDSTSADDVEQLMGGEFAQICFTSPPYAEQRKQQYGGIPVDKYIDWFDGIQKCVKHNLKQCGSFFVNIKAHTEDGVRTTYTYQLVLDMCHRFGWQFIDELYWNRQGFPGAFSNRFKNAIEPVYHFSLVPDMPFYPQSVTKVYSEKSTGNSQKQMSLSNSGFKGGNFYNSEDGALPSNLIYAPIGQTATQTGKYHPAVFPETLVIFFLQAFTKINDICLDVFTGSGTTLVACEQTGRIGYGMEIAPEYVAVILERLTGMGLEAMTIK